VEGAAIVVPPSDSAALAAAIVAAADDKSYGEYDPERRRSLAQQLSKTDGLRQFAAAALGLAPVAPTMGASRVGSSETTRSMEEPGGQLGEETARAAINAG
jgi:hypothetical protein